MTGSVREVHGWSLAALKPLLKKSNTLAGLYSDIQILRNVYVKDQKAAFQSYLAASSPACLHIGAGTNKITGWLETDLNPKDKSVLYMDATKPFPAPDSSFDFIYCEHMIEHIPRKAAIAMLRECKRVMKPGGVIRIATPDLAVLLSLHNSDSELAREYVSWISENFVDDDLKSNSAVVINNAFRAWGHQFIYDEQSLAATLKQAGFKDVSRCEYNMSESAALRGIEQHGNRMHEEKMVRFETIIVEAKP